MSSYLLDCNCGNKVPVEIGQAGGRVTCSCGTQLDVPPLRQLRHLPVVAPKEKAAKTGWGTGHGAIAASLILAGALTIANIWSRLTQPAVPIFDSAIYERDVEHMVTTITPTDAWYRWTEYYRPLAERGFPVFEASNRAEIERQIAHRQFLRRALRIATTIFAATAAVVAFWPRPRPRV